MISFKLQKRFDCAFSKYGVSPFLSQESLENISLILFLGWLDSCFCIFKNHMAATLELVILLAIGFLAGIVNTLAGGG